GLAARRGGEAQAVDLAVGGDRQGVEGDEYRGDHRLGELAAEELAEGGGGAPGRSRRPAAGRQLGRRRPPGGAPARGRADGEEGVAVGAGEELVLLDVDLEAAGREEPGRPSDGAGVAAVRVVDLHDDLLDLRPVRLVDPGQDVELGALDVDLQ